MISSEEIRRLVGFKPNSEHLYRNAFVHKSASKALDMKSNETLEFVGDAAISLIVAHYLFEKYPEENEGFLTRVRTKIVSNKGLTKLASILELDRWVVMNDRGLKSGWNKNPRILEDAFESLMGALYLDRGFETAKKFLVRLIEKHLDFEDVVEDTNYKDILMKHLHSQGLSSPAYKITHEAGPDHAKRFTIQIEINGKKVSEGSGNSKKDAEQLASHRALKSMLII